jgi:outer membrane protein assembly factor BamB
MPADGVGRYNYYMPRKPTRLGDRRAIPDRRGVMKPKALLAVLCFAVWTLVSGAADWPAFRGPGGLGISQEKDLPTTWSDTKNVVWKTKMPGPGGSSPITLADRVFVTCYSGYGTGKDGELANLRRHLLCLDRRSGNIKWSKAIKAPMPETHYDGFIALHGYASSTPASDGERVYVLFGKSGVLAYNLDGKQLWKADVGSHIHDWGSASSPVLTKKLVIVNAGVESGALIALDKSTGDKAWIRHGVEQTWGTPVLVDLKDGKQELALSMPGQIIGLDPQTGKELWRCTGINDYICPSVIAKDGIVYAIGGRRATALAVRAGGRGNVTDTHRLWEKSVGSNVTSPVIVGDYLFWVSDGGVAYCLKADTGEEVYGERLPGAGRVYASVTAADSKLYVVSREKGTYVLAARPKFETLAHNTFASDKSIFNGSPAVSNGQLLLRSDRFVYCIGKK